MGSAFLEGATVQTLIEREKKESEGKPLTEIEKYKLLQPSISSLVERDVKKEEKRRLFENDTRRTREINIFDTGRGIPLLATSEVGSTEVASIPKEERKSIISRYAVGFLNYPESLLKGTGKFFYAPTHIGGKPMIDIGQSKLLSTKGRAYLDPDIQTAVATAGLIGVGGAFAKTVWGVGTTYQAYLTAKEPTPEHFGELTFFALPLGYKGIKKIIPGYETVKIPTAKAPEGKTIYKGLTLFGKPVVGKGEKGLGIGYQKLSQAAMKEISPTKYVPETKLQTRYALDIATGKYPKIETQKALLSLGLMRKTEKVPSRFLQKQMTRDIKSLEKKQVGEVLKFSKEEKAMVYGSITAEAQLPKGALGKGRGIKPGEPVIADIDVQLRAKQETAMLKAEQLSTRLGKVGGRKVRVSPTQPPLIESYDPKTKAWRHAVDIHSIDMPLDADIPTEGAWGFRFGQKPIKIEKIQTMRLSEFGIRKGASALTLRPKGFAPEPHRMKDIPDFLTSQEWLIKSTRRGKGLKELAELKEIYGREGKLPKGRVRMLISETKPPSKSLFLAGAPSSLLGYKYPSKKKPSISKLSKSMKKEVSPSKFISPSISKRPSISPSRPSISPSPPVSPSYLRSLSRSVKKEVSPSPSKYLKGFVSPSISKSFKYTYPSPSKPPKPPQYPSMPSYPALLFGGRRVIKKGRGKPREYRYTPSLLGVVAQTASLIGKKKFTGFEVRGIVTKRRRKKKK